MNSIYNCVDSFNKLLDIEYHIVLGRKGQNIELKVLFRKQDCFHLMGLHYLKDRAELNGSSQVIFNKILKRQIRAEQIEKTKYYDENIKKRIHFLASLENLFDSNETIFRYDPKIQAFSVIEADFLLKNNINEINVFIFLSKERESADYFCRSFFSDTKKGLLRKPTVLDYPLQKENLEKTQSRKYSL